MSDLEPPVVIDIGSGWVRSGIAGDGSPLVVHQTAIGRPKYVAAMAGLGTRLHYVGEEVIAKRGIMRMSSPFVDGDLSNFDEYDKVVHQEFFNELRVTPETRPTILSAPIHAPIMAYEKAMQSMFESFNVPSLVMAPAGLLGWYASGRSVVLNVDLGESGYQIFPVFEGFTFVNAHKRCKIGGSQLNTYFARLLTEQNRAFNAQNLANLSSNDQTSLSELRHRFCYAALDYESELSDFLTSIEKHVTVDLPDGTQLQVTNARVRTIEALFKPALLGLESPGIHKLIYSSIMKCPIDVRKSLFGNISISGGLSMTPGLPTRLEAEIKKLAPATMKVKVLSADDRRHQSWIGGSILGSMESHLEKSSVSKAEYDECGPQLATKKGPLAVCFKDSWPTY